MPDPVQDFIKAEPIPLSPGQKLGQDLVEHTTAFESVYLWAVFCDEGPGPLLSVQEPAELHLPIGSYDCVWIDFKVHGQLTNRRKLVTWREVASGDSKLHRFDNLPVKWYPAFWIDGDSQGFGPERVLVYYCSGYIVQFTSICQETGKNAYPPSHNPHPGIACGCA